MAVSPDQPNYISTKNKHSSSVIANYSVDMTKHQPTMAGAFTNVEDNISVRPPYHRGNYEKWRPNDAIPTDPHQIMKACRHSYETVGIIRSVIDLMTEIAVEGLTLVHENVNTQTFFQSWAKRICLEERSERFSNNLLVEGNVSIRSKYGNVNNAEVQRMRRKITTGGSKVQADFDEQGIEPGMIPLEYIFYDPVNLELIGGELALFSGKKVYGIKVNVGMIARLRTLWQQSKHAKINIGNDFPPEIKQILDAKQKNTFTTLSGDLIIPIPENRFYIDHYKKRDSEIWGKSFIFSILHDVIYNEKLRVAKISALDNWHNSYRIWKLGDHKQEILPTDAQFAHLANILENGSGAGGIDIIWDSMIEFQQEFPPIEKLNGFEENFESILLGLGIHRSLVGGSDKTPSGANAFVGLRNIMKRIDSIRRSLRSWIEHETKIVAQNLGIKNTPTVRFSLNNLFDQQSYFKLLMDLNDRDVVSNETILDKIGESMMIETRRIQSQQEEVLEGERPEKKGPFIQPKVPDENQKKQKDIINTNFNNQEKSKDKERVHQDKMAAKESKETSTGKPPDKAKPPKSKGRPSGSKDKVLRTRKMFSKSETMLLADKIQDKLDLIVDVEFLVYNNKGNKRRLTAVQKTELEQAKLEMLPCIENLSFESLEDIEKVLETGSNSMVAEFKDRYKTALADAGPKPTAHQIKMIKSLIYSEMFSD